MLTMARHTFISILRTRIFWVMLIFSLLIMAIVGYFLTRTMILSAPPIQEDRFGRRHHYHNERDVADYILGRKGPSREEVDDMEMPIMDYGCTPEMTGPGQMFTTPLVAGIQYFGFIAMAFYSNLASIFLMMGLLPGELEKRSIYTLLSKPLSRGDIFFGKLLGGWGAVIVFNFALALMLTIFMFLAGTPFKPKFLLVGLVSSLSPMMYGAIALSLGTFLRTTAVSFFTIILLFFSADVGSIFVYTIGNQLLHWEKLTDFILTYLPPLAKIKVLVSAFINYNLFTNLSELFQSMDICKVYGKWWLNAVFIACYFIVIILIGWGVFRKKEFN